MRKALGLLFEIACLLGALYYMANAALGFDPSSAPDVSLGWACLLLLIANLQDRK